MALVNFNWNPTTRQLRQFAGMCLVMLPLLGWIWSATFAIELALIVAGIVIFALSWIAPKSVRPLFIGLSVITTPLGRVFGELALLIVFYGAFLPVGLWFRITNRDALGLRPRKDVASYWRKKPRPAGVASYYRQS